MELKKAKTIIIAMLLIFNVFLLYSNLTYYKSQGVQKETLENAEKILKARGVTLNCDIPTAPRGLHRLEYGNAELDRTAIAQNLLGNDYTIESEDQVYQLEGKKLVFDTDAGFVFTDENPVSGMNISSMDKAEKDVRSYLEGHGLIKDGYIVDEQLRNEDGSVRVVFIEKLDGFLIYDNFCVATLSKKGVTRIEYGRRQTLGFASKKIEDPTEAYQALLAYFNEGENSVITSIDLGYKYSEDQTMDDMESLEMLPVWRVKIKDLDTPLYLGTPIETPVVHETDE